jgi:hypothetical protein
LRRSEREDDEFRAARHRSGREIDVSEIAKMGGIGGGRGIEFGHPSTGAAAPRKTAA